MNEKQKETINQLINHAKQYKLELGRLKLDFKHSNLKVAAAMIAQSQRKVASTIRKAKKCLM